MNEIIKNNKKVKTGLYEIGDIVYFKSSDANQFLKSRYIGPAKIIDIHHKKCYLILWKNKEIWRHESHLKCANNFPEVSKQTTTSNLQRKYPKRVRKEVMRYV